MAPPGDSTESRKGPRVPSAGKPADLGKGMGASPTLGVVARSKTTVAVAEQRQGSGGSGTVLHGDHGNDGVGRQPHAEGLEQDW
jgi:hypothetical protein